MVSALSERRPGARIGIQQVGCRLNLQRRTKREEERQDTRENAPKKHKPEPKKEETSSRSEAKVRARKLGVSCDRKMKGLFSEEILTHEKQKIIGKFAVEVVFCGILF